MLRLEEVKIAVVGLGYVGLPLAVEFGKHFPTVGFDIQAERIAELRDGHDSTLEVSAEELAEAKQLSYAEREAGIAGCNVYIATVPTPIDRYKRPDLTPLIEYYRAESSIPVSGRAGDISEGGLLVYLSERVEVGEHLKVRCLFTLISELMNTMEIRGEVVWVVLESVETKGHVGKYKCRVKFIDVKPVDVEKLKVFLQRLAKL